MPQTNFLTFSHSPQVSWWSHAARDIARRLDARAVAWVLGSGDRKLAESGGCFHQVVDLLEGFELDGAAAALDHNLERIQRYEADAGARCFHQDVAMDRHLARAGWSLEQIIHYAAHILRSMDRELGRLGDPRALMSEANTLPYRLAYRLLRPRCFVFYPSMERYWNHRFFVNDSIDSARPNCQRLYREFLDGELPAELEQTAGQRLEQIRSKGEIPIYAQKQYSANTMGGTDPLSSKLQPQRAAGVLTRWISQLADPQAAGDPRSAVVRSPAAKLVAAAQEQARKLAFLELARPPAADGMQYCTYFLHVEPEYSVEGLAFEHRNQLATIENIAAALPGHVRLYVKEHRPMLGVRRANFYRALDRIPNVLLLHNDAVAHDIIRGSRAVFTLTGTPALEALFFGIPAVIFGDVYFESFQGVYQVKSVPQLRAAVGQIFSSGDCGATNRSALAALAAMHADSHAGKFASAYGLEEMCEPQNLGRVVDGVVGALESPEHSG